MIELLHAVDWVVDDPVECAARIVDGLVLPAVPAAWTQSVPSHRYDAVFAKTSVRLADAPTRLELIRTTDASGELCSLPPLGRIEAAQAGRQQRTHATVFCVRDFDEYVDRLRAAGTAVWIEPGCEHLPNRRGWISWTSGTERQTPATDAGLWLEFIPTAVLGRTVAASVTDGSVVPGPRVTRRTHLVDRLDDVVRTLERHTALVPASAIRVDRDLSAAVARYVPAHPASAVLELVEPVGDGPAASYHSLWGAGPWFTGIAVEDASAVVEGALAQGATRADDGLVEIDPGMLFEIAEVGS